MWIDADARPKLLIRELHKTHRGKCSKTALPPAFFPLMKLGSKKAEMGRSGLFRCLVAYRDGSPTGKGSCHIKMKLFRQLAGLEEKQDPIGSKPIIPGAAERTVLRVSVQPPQLHGPEI